MRLMDMENATLGPNVRFAADCVAKPWLAYVASCEWVECFWDLQTYVKGNHVEASFLPNDFQESKSMPRFEVCGVRQGVMFFPDKRISPQLNAHKTNLDWDSWTSEGSQLCSPLDEEWRFCLTFPRGDSTLASERQMFDMWPRRRSRRWTPTRRPRRPNCPPVFRGCQLWWTEPERSPTPNEICRHRIRPRKRHWFIKWPTGFENRLGRVLLHSHW